MSSFSSLSSSIPQLIFKSYPLSLRQQLLRIPSHIISNLFTTPPSLPPSLPSSLMPWVHYVHFLHDVTIFTRLLVLLYNFMLLLCRLCFRCTIPLLRAHSSKHLYRLSCHAKFQSFPELQKNKMITDRLLLFILIIIFVNISCIGYRQLDCRTIVVPALPRGDFFFLEAGIELDLLLEGHKLTWRRNVVSLYRIISKEEWVALLESHFNGP